MDAVRPHRSPGCDPPQPIKQDEEVKTRTLILLAAVCAVAILAASAIQVLLAH